MSIKINKSFLFKAALIVSVPFILHTYMAAHCTWYQDFLQVYLIDTGSRGFINSVASTLIGAFFGAAIAFHFQNTKDENKEVKTEKRLSSTLFYQYIDAYSFVVNYKRNFIDNGMDTNSSEFIINLMPSYTISYTPFEVDPDLPKFLINHKVFYKVLLDINKTRDLIYQLIHAINNHSNFIFNDFKDIKLKIIHFVQDAKSDGKQITEKDIVNDELVDRATYTQLEGYVRNIVESQQMAEQQILEQLRNVRTAINKYFEGDIPDFLKNVKIIDDGESNS